MKAYTVHRFYVCQLTSDVVARISFNEVSEDLHFPTIDFANNHINKSKRDWFLQTLEKFVNHKKKIIENSQVSDEKQKSLNVCLEAYNVYCNKSLENIVSGFLKGKKYFEFILPHTSNDSHATSKQTLDELIKFCETETLKK